MNIYQQMKNAAAGGLAMAKAKQAEKAYKIKEKEDKEKGETYKAQGIPFCPRCYAINLKTNKKKYNVGTSEGKPVLLDNKGEVIGPLYSRNVDVVCTCCGYKWKPTKENK